MTEMLYVSKFLNQMLPFLYHYLNFFEQLFYLCLLTDVMKNDLKEVRALRARIKTEISNKHLFS